ncbi:conserved hypothetical protein [Teredinibacter turnerae T7901]|uniref:Purine nucleoside phosphorylase n=1 Tax=Teredinibacter turnerae (strain ATCC 39867 / T7901) TaxID=377629 RepID=C5BQY7_TERTT|nr:peptidoglycan editing factor PgeF [Teredinibacter turnerae]ACR14009.1 conserved hypothetical protein [Teredinibacter turnerae T7901]
MMQHLFEPEWECPPGVQARVTLRSGGVSQAPYESNNLASHVGDRAEHVARNREWLQGLLPSEPTWLTQTHSTVVWREGEDHCPKFADGIYSATPNRVCAVLTADCMPVLMASNDGREVAAVHAGWRGLAQGILSEAIQCFRAAPKDIAVYLGPAISQPCFEVGADVKTAFDLAASKRYFDEDINASFCPSGHSDKCYADLFRLARAELCGVGVKSVFGGNRCTYSEPQSFYSYRRDGVTGRFASLIWIDR